MIEVGPAAAVRHHLAQIPIDRSAESLGRVHDRPAQTAARPRSPNSAYVAAIRYSMSAVRRWRERGHPADCRARRPSHELINAWPFSKASVHHSSSAVGPARRAATAHAHCHDSRGRLRARCTHDAEGLVAEQERQPSRAEVPPSAAPERSSRALALERRRSCRRPAPWRRRGLGQPLAVGLVEQEVDDRLA